MACPSCGLNNPTGFHFCGACGAALGDGTLQREERKVITVVFCDLVGSTAQGEQLDPEDVHALLSRYHAGVRAQLERFGGTLEKFIGDAVVAVFGAPLAHEDDPERAVRAAIAVREWVTLQPDLHVRLAVNTGEAFVVLGARAGGGEHQASGDVLNTAARLQSAAPVDGILVGEQTFRATDRVIDYRQHEPIAAKGKSAPVRVWEVVQARPDAKVRPPRAGLVGRESELRRLHEAFERAREKRKPQFVTLLGVPGIGKSRIVDELSRSVDDDLGQVAWRQGRCLPYGEGISFWALGEIVKQHAGILESDARETVEAKLSECVAGAVPSEDVDWVMRWLSPLVGGAAEMQEGGRTEPFPAWRRFLEGVAMDRPAVFVFEDLHWADDGLLDFIEQLAESTTRIPMLVLCTARPEFLSRRSGWLARAAAAVTLPLSALSEEETTQLVHDLIARAVLPSELQQQLLERAGGNPLYAEEFARMVSERGTSNLSLPQSVQGIIASRLDALEPVHKRLVQDAAVLGERFWGGAVAAMDGAPPDELGRGLRELERRELIRRESASSVEGQTEFAFHHVLTRDVAYAQIPRAQRAKRHRRAADWIASLGRPEDHAELLAHHYLEALGYARAGGADISDFSAPALAALSEAGDRASSLGAYPVAARYLRAALELVGDDDPERGRLLYRYGAALLWGEMGGKEPLEEAVELLAEQDKETAARAALLLGYLEWTQVSPEAVRRWFALADELLAELPESIVKTEALTWQAYYALIVGDGERGKRLAREALARLGDVDRPDLRSRCFDLLGAVRVGEGDASGMDDQRHAVQIAREGRAIWELHVALGNVAGSLRILGFLREWEAQLAEQLRAVEEFGATWDIRGMLVNSQAWVDYLAGRWDAAIDATERFLANLEPGSKSYVEWFVREVRVPIHLARGESGPARSQAERLLELARGTGEQQLICPSLLARARARLAAGKRRAALADLDQLLDTREGLAFHLAGSLQMPAFAWLALDLGRRGEAEAVVANLSAPRWRALGSAILSGDEATAVGLLDEIGDLPGAAFARLRAGGPHLVSALEFYRSVGATRYVCEAESQLAASA